MCYYQGELEPSALDAKRCSHYICSFKGFHSDGSLTDISWKSPNQVENHLRGLVALRKINPDLHVVIAFGGAGGVSNEVWASMASNEASRNRFAQNCLNYVRKHNLNGVGEF